MKKIKKFKSFSINEDFRDDPTSPFNHPALKSDNPAKNYNDGIGNGVENDPSIRNIRSEDRSENMPIRNSGKIYPFYIDETPVIADGTEKTVYVEPGTQLAFDDVIEASTWSKSNPVQIKEALNKPNGIAAGYIWSYSEIL